MPTGPDLILRVVDRVPEMGDDTGTLSAAEEARILRTLNQKLEVLNGDIASLGEDYQLNTFDWVTDPAQPQNRYSIGAGGDIAIGDFKDARYLEIIIDDSQGWYEQVLPLQQLQDKSDTNEIIWFDFAGSGGPGKPGAYFLGSNFLQLVPLSDQVYNMRLWYTQRFPEITTAATELPIPPELTEYLVYASAADEKTLRNETEASMLFQAQAAASKKTGLDNLQVHRDDAPVMMHFLRYSTDDYV